MSSLSKRLLLLYLIVIVLLAALGAYNQELHATRIALMAQKVALEAERVELRGRAATVTGPMAVRAWAVERGMVPAAQLGEAAAILRLEPPEVATPQTGLELWTVWR
jgi:hypothetical protein